MTHGCKVALQLRHQLGIGAALEHFCQERAARIEHLAGEMRGGLDQRLRAEMIERFDLDPRRRARTYSKGNRQKVALVAALASGADLYLFDEPTSGLDPLMEAEFQRAVVELKHRGATVLLSSHILAEVQQVCHSVSIVGRGRLLASGPVQELLGDTVSRTRLVVADPRGAQHFLETAGHTVTRDGAALLVEGHGDPARLTRLLAERGLFVSELTEVRPTLESFFLGLTGRRDAQRDQGAAS